jgi:ribosome-associated heat shock protein Hsp15
MSSSIRIDKWLWHARFCKTRSIAQAKAEAGQIRLNGQRVAKSSAQVRPGDIMTLSAGRDVLVVKVVSLGERRGPAAEARRLYALVEDNA